MTTPTRNARPAPRTGDASVPPSTAKPPVMGTQPRTPRAFYWMVLPAVVLFFTFHTLPVLQGAFFSSTDSPGYGDWGFVGIANYLALFTDERVRDAYVFTFQFAFVTTILVNAIALALAVGLNGKIKFKNTLRGVYSIPNVLGILVIGCVFQYLFTKGTDTGGGVPGFPPWCADGGAVVLTGRVLAVTDVQIPPLHPEHLLLVRATAL